MTPYAWTVIKYVLAVVGGALAASLAVVVVQLGTNDPIAWKPIIAAGLGPIIVGLTTSRWPQPERADLSTQVDHLKESNIPVSHLVVVDAGTKRAADQITNHAEDALEGKSPLPVNHELPRT